MFPASLENLRCLKLIIVCENSCDFRYSVEGSMLGDGGKWDVPFSFQVCLMCHNVYPATGDV
jgi:hypothetical protein